MLGEFCRSHFSSCKHGHVYKMKSVNGRIHPAWQGAKRSCRRVTVLFQLPNRNKDAYRLPLSLRERGKGEGIYPPHPHPFSRKGRRGRAVARYARAFSSRERVTNYALRYLKGNLQ